MLPTAWAAGIDLTVPASQTQTQVQAPPPPGYRPETTDLAQDVFAGKREEHLDATTLETLLKSLLALYPEAPVVGLRPDGVVVAMPDSVPLVLFLALALSSLVLETAGLALAAALSS